MLMEDWKKKEKRKQESLQGVSLLGKHEVQKEQFKSLRVEAFLLPHAIFFFLYTSVCRHFIFCHAKGA